MALGDYTRTTYVNDTTPALNGTNLNNIEAKVDELDNATAIINVVGEVKLYAGASVPTGYLLCNGQAVSRTTYAALYTAIGTTWGVGNGSSTFNVPDMREAVPVGVGTFSAVTGTTRGAEVAADVYTLGQFKDDQGQGHVHAMGDFDYGTKGASTSGAWYDNNVNRNTGGPVTDGTNGTPRVGTVTRTKQIGVNYIIKY